MKKGISVLFWIDYGVVVSVPLLFVLASKFDWNEVLGWASSLALFWVIASLLFLFFAISMGIALKKTKAEEEHLKKNFQETILILILAVAGASLWLIKRKIPTDMLWNVIIIFWIIFTAYISKTLVRFVRRYQREAP